MISSHSFTPEPNPYKRPRLSQSPHHRYSSYYPSSYTPPQPSLANLAQDRLASRTKLQSTWEDIIQKYSTISSSEADEIDLETGEIVVDHGHLKSLHDSALWDPIDSEPDYDEEEEDELPEPVVEEQIPETTVPQEEPKLPPDEEILKQFGEEYGREILAYLQQRNSSVPAKTLKNALWTGPANEDAIFTRAKELWRQFQLKRPTTSSSQPRKFDKESFERAVFGSFERAVFGVGGPNSRTAFDEAVFGRQQLQQDWTDEDEGVFGQRERTGEKDGGFEQHRQGKMNFEEIIFGQHQQKWIAVEEATFGGQPSQELTKDGEPRINNAGRLASYATDDWSPERKPRRTESPICKRPETPTTNRKRIRTPSSKSVIPESTRKLSAQAREKLRGNVVSGLIIDGSDDDEEDFFSQTPVKSTVKEGNRPETSFWSKIGMGSPLKVTSQSPLKMKKSQSPLNMRRSQSVKTVDDELQRSQSPLKMRSRSSSKVRSQSVKTVDDDEDIIVLDIFDTKGKCGDVGYRCSKAFCFKCVP